MTHAIAQIEKALYTARDHTTGRRNGRSIVATSATVGEVAIPPAPLTLCKCRMGSPSPTSGDTKPGRMSPSVRPMNVLKVIVANPAMIDAYRAGVPGNGKPFPDGSKIAKIEWTPKKSTEAPFSVKVPDTLKTVSFIEKDSKRFPDTADGDTPCSSMTRVRHV